MSTRRTRSKAKSDESTAKESEVSVKSITRKRVKSDSESEDEGSSSDSSVGNYLTNADEIDLNSSFFTHDNSEKPPDFDAIERKIFSGIQTLSDSEESASNDESTSVSDVKTTESFENSQDVDNKKINFSQLREYNEKLEAAKACVKKYESKKKSKSENKLDITTLLSVGETKINESQEPMERSNSDLDTDDEMDWEEIEENEEKPADTVTIPKEGVQITVEMPTVVRKKKSVDFIAAVKRRINRIKKENQVYIHKVHLLCWIAHGNFINSVLNNESLLGVALSLLPSEQCYPPKHADMSYLEQIVRWYGKMMKLQEKPSDETDVPLLESIQQQIAKKQARSKRDLVLIFIIILRSLGLQCRLILSLQCLPFRPPSSELCSLSTKEKEANSKADKKEKDKESSESMKPSTSKTKDTSNESSTKVTSNKSSKSSTSKVNLNTSKSTSAKPNLSRLKKAINIAKSSPTSDEKTKTATKNKSKEIKKTVTNPKKEEKPPKAKTRTTRSDKTPVKISQLDGADDSPSTSKSNSNKISLSQKLKKNQEGKSEFSSKSERLPRKAKSKSSNNIDPASVEDTDFKPKLKRTTANKKDINDNKKIPKDSLRTKQPKNDVKSDIINLIKGQMTAQRHAEKTKIVKNKNLDSDDSDYAPEPVVKKRKSQKKSNSEDDFKFEVNTKVKRRVKPRSEIDKRVLSTDSDESSQGGKKKKVGNDIWVEVFLESEEKWISADVIKGQVHCVSELHSRASQPISYILAWNNNLSLKDVTARYCPNWNTVTRKLRVDSAWWTDTLRPYIGIKNARDKEEDEDLARQQLDQPLPTTISEYKNHPLYALKRHLLKFEAIYPPDAVTLGFVRNEAVYARECVHTLHSREIWVKHAKVVKLGEQPYKIVKARPKYDKLTGNTITDLPLEIFGSWQVQDYEPPTAENGVVPRNAFGNVELFKACMLPKKTVHLQLPGLNKVARKLNIDCAPAVVGFDFHCGGSHPTFDGYVVCEEFKDVLIAAWEQDQAETAKKELEKYEKRVYGNWRKLIKGLLIRERLKARYDFGDPTSKSSKNKSKSKGSKVITKKRRICSDNESDSD